ncbi:T9SS type A sorting domain-containing protein [uncultured Aquimarina sp.]|uniref:T9SS type A sorting domain-containing protein n=1 Tax=uncultured Aquimarina sp. TaxID=575652 RepID=UPI00260FAD01|nr:T9SS type A sorting domain-containing protein [uncultured Aquimarina sp.]
MKSYNQNVFVQFGSQLFDISKPLVLFILLLIASQTATFSQVSFEGSWGVTFPIFGGERLDGEINLNQKDYMGGAQEIVDELPTAGHVITNLSYFAHSHYFNTRANTNIDVANEIHPAMIPSVENDGVAVEAIQLLRNSGKKIILYISTNYLDRATGDLKEGWVNYYTTKFGGNEYLAYRHLIQGFVEAAADYADGYWLDTTSALRGDGNFGDFVAMIREADPTALIASGGASRLTHNGEDVYVDSDGVNDTNPADYYVKLHDSNDPLPDFTDGHIVPLGQGAPPNSWSYEEFMIPNMMVEPFYTASNGKQVQKHGWFPIRERWHSPQVPIVFNTEEAYRFVRRITDYGGMITFANTNQTPNLGDGRAGHMMSDEMTIMKEVNRRLIMDPKPDYVPYTRPQGASLVEETQYIEFPDIPTKEVGDPDFIAATATSGLTVSFTSSNTNVAKIVNGKVHIVGPGKTTITAIQQGAGAFTSAVPAERPLVVTRGGVEKQDQVITFPPFPIIRVGDPDFDPGVTASSGLTITYTSGNTNVATIVNGKIRIVGEGRSYITASQAGNATYNAAPDRSRVLTVNASTIGSSTLVHITKRNAKGYAVDGNWGGDNGQNIYLYSQNPSNENQQWIEINRGNGYYSYQKKGTNFCMDGGNGGVTRQNVYLWTCNENNQNQHWQKVDVGGGAFKLIKRNAPGFALNGGSGGSNTQNIALWNSSSDSQNLHWIITPIEGDKDPDVIDTNEVFIYPNPVTDQVNLSLDTTETSTYTISDVNGKTILKGVINEGSVSLDINGLAKGLYLLKVSNRSKVLTRKIIKQ